MQILLFPFPWVDPLPKMFTLLFRLKFVFAQEFSRQEWQKHSKSLSQCICFWFPNKRESEQRLAQRYDVFVIIFLLFSRLIFDNKEIIAFFLVDKTVHDGANATNLSFLSSNLYANVVVTKRFSNNLSSAIMLALV